MSKRFKASKYSSSGAPIPSFESFGSQAFTSSSASMMTASPTTTAVPTGEASSPSDNIKLLNGLNESERNSILHFSNAVEMQLHRLGVQTSQPRRRIPLHFCYDLMEKTQGLSLPVLPEKENQWKNEKEVFLYKFLYVSTMAQLYEIHCEEESSSLLSEGRGRKLSSRWYLQQCTPQGGNRRTFNDVRAKLFDPSRPISPRSNQQLRLAVLSLRPKEAPATQHLTQSSKIEADTKLPTMKEGCTVEERVRAKHEARLLREETRVVHTKPNASSDETWRLRIADALWHQSRQVLHRHEKFASPKRTTNPSSCSFILGDVVQLITEQSGVMGTKLKRRQIVELLQELCRELPEWIRRSAAKQCESKDWDRNDTLWIQPLDYQKVRLRLLGKVSTSSISKAPSKLLGSLTASTNIERAFKPDESHVKKRNRPDSIVPDAKRELWKEFPGEDPSSPPENKKIRKDSVSIGPRSISPASPPKKRLRVNPHLILSDADHQGGDIIVPSQHDSPRGLKNLFRQLNSGKRI